MEIKDIKKRMLGYKDFYGGDLLNIDQIESCKTKKELAQILWNHYGHMESMLADASSHLQAFKKEIGLELA